MDAVRKTSETVNSFEHNLQSLKNSNIFTESAIVKNTINCFKNVFQKVHENPQAKEKLNNILKTVDEVEKNYGIIRKIINTVSTFLFGYKPPAQELKEYAQKALKESEDKTRAQNDLLLSQQNICIKNKESLNTGGLKTKTFDFFKDKVGAQGIGDQFEKDYTRGYKLFFTNQGKTEDFSQSKQDINKDFEGIQKGFGDDFELLKKLSLIVNQNLLIDSTLNFFIDGYTVAQFDSDIEKLPTLIEIEKKEDGNFSVIVNSVQRLNNNAEGNSFFVNMSVTIELSFDAANRLNNPDIPSKEALMGEGISFNVDFSSPSLTSKFAIESMENSAKKNTIIFNNLQDHVARKSVE